MENKKVKYLLYAEEQDMGGIPIRQPFPTFKVPQVDPFLLLHHADITIPRSVKPLHAGIGPHPHRGFSPVTFIFNGAVHHRDSRGNNSIVYAGGAQWMNAAKGVVHSERPPADIHEIGGRQELIQLWINTPAKHKMDQPEYFALQREDIPSFVLDDGLGTISVVAGTLFDLTGPVSPKSPVIAATMRLKPGARVKAELPKGHNALIYALDGKINLGGFGLMDGFHAAVFEKDADGITVEALHDTRVLLLSGEPLNEEVVSRGPFVMNTETQILEAMRDYQKGKMGILIED